MLPDVRGAEVRLRVRVAPDQRDSARRAAQEYAEQLRSAGAISVKVEEQVVSTTRARTPEVARASTLIDKLDALWLARRDVPSPERRDALVSKIAFLEGQQ
jgi:2-methylisocitrate lyase-like PEP mutase family enzyme